jgi:glycosyltransferase involved in cell wall biosynthesis
MSIKRVYYWVGLTATQPFNTGVQRLTRCLAVELQKRGIEVIPVKWDEVAGQMGPITQSEADHLAKWGGPKLVPPSALTGDFASEWLILPEITFPVVPPGSNVALHGKSLGMKVAAVFYDLIPLKTPEYYDDATLRLLGEYWDTFADADIAIPISETVRFELIEWLLAKGSRVPFVVSALLSGEIPGVARTTEPAKPGAPFRLVAVGTWEPRKNYPRIIRAIQKARKVTGRDIRLTIIGRHTQGQFLDLYNEVVSLAAQCGPGVIDLNAYLSDDEMAHLYKDAQATIFGSWIEGFGLPVLESLWRGLPCICHEGSALAEVAPGGGTIMVDMEREDKITEGIARLASDAGLFERLSNEAVTRPLRRWADYATDVLAVIDRAELMLPLLAYDPLAAENQIGSQSGILDGR